jgi:DNA-binding transcriptional regulator YhcF (GntR family)
MPDSPERHLQLPPLVTRTAQLANRIGGDIRSGRLRAGDRLPTEQELIAQFQVSRTVVREAMAALRTEGLIVSRQGAGVFVSDGTVGRPFRIASDELRSLEEVENVLQLRLAVEVEAAGIADRCRDRTGRDRGEGGSRLPLRDLGGDGQFVFRTIHEFPWSGHHPAADHADRP